MEGRQADIADELPPLNVPSWTALMMLNTPGVISFIALESRMALASGSVRYWSVSTPMPQDPPFSAIAEQAAVAGLAAGARR